MKSILEKKIMKNYKNKWLSAFCVVMIATLFSSLHAQKRDIINIKTILVDEENNPIPNAKIELGDGLVTTYSNPKGEVSIQAKKDNILLISANGYQTQVIKLSPEFNPEKIVLLSDVLFNGDEHILELPANSEVSQRALTGSVAKVSGTELESQPDVVFHNALQGRLPGVITRMTTNGLGNNQPNIYVRGLSRHTANTALTIVDGIERPLEFLVAEEIESVEVLKDASAKILYGPRAANGVILVTTKKGRKNTNVIKASVEYGANMNTRMAKYLNSADYATLYNEALENDGFSSMYSAEQIAAYGTSSGENDLLYPNIDHNSYFVNNSAPLKKATFEASGGTDDSQYGVYLGYIGTEGIEKIGEEVYQDRVNIRGNLSFNLTDNLVGYAQVNGIIEERHWGKLGQDQVFAKISTERPNEFPLVIEDPNFVGESTTLGDEPIPPLGGSFQNRTSLYGEMAYGGYQEYLFFYGQTDFGLDWDLNKIVPGLSAKTRINFDNYQYHAADQINNQIRYAIETDQDTGEPVYIKLNQQSVERNRTERSSSAFRTFGSTSNITYEKTINDEHNIKLDLSYFYFLNQNNSRFQHLKNGNTTLKANYSYKDKLYLDLSLAQMTSNKFIEDNRNFLSHAVGAAWIVSEEDFFTTKAFDYLKLKSSYGVLGYDLSTDFYLFETRYDSNGSVNLGELNSNSVGRVSFNTNGNPDLDWEKAKEFNIGMEALMFDKSVQFEVNYFNQLRQDIIYTSPTSITTSIEGQAKTPRNLGEVMNQGIDGSINWFKNFGDLKLNLGANFLISKNEIKVADDVDNLDSNLNLVGNSSDAIYGYVSNGIFKTQAEVDAAPVQMLGDYGVGNVSYQDLNGDGVINEQDQKVIGNTLPRSSFGFNLNAKYKGFGLSALGVLMTGVDIVKNNAFYRNSGQGKYSTLATDRFHPVNNPNGTQPKLTTLTPLNDNVTSTFWMENAAFFRLKNVELSYTLANDTWIAKKTKFYVRGTNLFVLSDVKDLDPEVPQSGVTNYPVFRTITGGVSLSF